ncbi:hypothetical protein ACVWZR_002023 [Bradyrhizobium sp. i1.3.1]
MPAISYLAQECRQLPLGSRPSRCLAGRAPAKVRPSSSCAVPTRQDRRGEANPVAIAGHRAIPNLYPGHFDGADPVWIVRTGPWPNRTRRSRLSGTFKPFIAVRNASASISTACASSCRAPHPKIFASGSMSGRADAAGKCCCACSWRIALLERFWQARHGPRHAAYPPRDSLRVDPRSAWRALSDSLEYFVLLDGLPPSWWRSRVKLVP